ncbi:MAG: gluconate 2-dehydrogenase subunit 3 family protein, partial [Thermomicrobiaceae bacterium]|nr:gluconate 2-dehydrogenase subunit 3 family protein [Thermomicrobiaceae bacterium]
MSGVDGGLQFFSAEEAETVEALAARILPGSPDDPGAREAGVVTYIDRALAGPYARWQSAYRAGVRAVNAFAARRYGRPLAALDEAAQDAVLAALERGEV